jgi:hypothetical protein
MVSIAEEMQELLLMQEEITQREKALAAREKKARMSEKALT